MAIVNTRVQRWFVTPAFTSPAYIKTDSIKIYARPNAQSNY